ncbi:MAG: exodeoxyribonuclease VII small subunit, partial [Acidimicrobiales bacterium]
HELERGDIDLDRLSEQVRRAADLVRFCRGRLDDTRTEVTRIVADLDGESDARVDDRAAP